MCFFRPLSKPRKCSSDQTFVERGHWKRGICMKLSELDSRICDKSAKSLPRPFDLPSDTKLLLTKNYSDKKIYIGKFTNVMRNSLKKSFFSGDLEGTKVLKNDEKYFAGKYFRNNFVSEGTRQSTFYFAQFWRRTYGKFTQRPPPPLANAHFSKCLIVVGLTLGNPIEMASKPLQSEP